MAEHGTSTAAKQRWGLLAVAWTGLWAALRYDFPTIRVEAQDATGKGSTEEGTFILVGNIERWAGDAIMIPGADSSDELLDIVVFSSCRRSHLLRFWALAALPGRRHLRLPGVKIIRAHRLFIDSGETVEVHINGDRHPPTPVRLVPSGPVRLIVPRSVSNRDDG